jgi:polyhydroxyalkanoic acid synthase PhaR subunit
MNDQKTDNTKAFDPFEPFRGMRDAYLEAMSKTMIESVNTEEYAQASGAMIDNYLTMSAPFREALEKSMAQALQQLSLPSRQELAALAGRFTNFEMRLDDLDANFSGIETLEKSVAQTLQQLSATSQKEAGALAERITGLEKRLDGLDGKLDRIAMLLAENKKAKSEADTKTAPTRQPKQRVAAAAKNSTKTAVKSRRQASAGRTLR